MRKIRFIPPGGALVEVTVRTQQGRFLLRPSQTLNQIAVGVLARALKYAEVRFHGIVCMSNHAHLLLTVQDAKELASFMNYLSGNLARLVAKLHNWPDKVWSRRYQAIVLSNEPESAEKRLRYFLSHGAKEDLVSTPRDWPGLHLAKNIVDGEPLRGYWIDRSLLSAARASAKYRGKEVDPMDFATFYEIPVEPLPHWQDQPFEEYREFVKNLLHEIEQETLDRRRKEMPRIPGPQSICKADPHHRPTNLESSPAPLFHAATRRAFQALRDGYTWFVAAYRIAAEQLRKGNLRAMFPEGCFPPALPFVPG